MGFAASMVFSSEAIAADEVVPQPQLPQRQVQAANYSGGGTAVGGYDKRAAFLLIHQKEIKLTPDQIAAVQKIAVESQEKLNRHKKELDAFARELQAALGQEQPDTVAAKALVDKYFPLLASNTKENIDSLSSVQAILTPGQRVSARKLLNEVRQERREGRENLAGKSGQKQESPRKAR